MSQPISLALLVHSAELYSCTGENQYGQPSWSSTKVELTKIRVSSTKHMTLTALGEAKNDLFVLTFDCTNSLPFGTTFNERDKIVYNGKTYFVREVNAPSGDSSGVHHYRLALVGSW